MSKYAHVKALSVSEGDTADFVFYEIEGHPSLTCLPATSINRSFFNAVLKRRKELARKLRGRKNEVPTEAEMAAVRKQDAELFVQYIVTGWSDVIDVDGNEVEFSQEECQEFLMAIPQDMFEDLRNFCLDISNFRQQDRMDPEEQDELAGN